MIPLSKSIMGIILYSVYLKQIFGTWMNCVRDLPKFKQWEPSPNLVKHINNRSKHERRYK